MTTYHKSLKAGRGRRTAPVPLALRHWLQANPRAWSGWPTFDAHDYEDTKARVSRLVAAGCTRDLLRSLSAVNQAVAQLRLERREKLARNVARVGL